MFILLKFLMCTGPQPHHCMCYYCRFHSKYVFRGGSCQCNAQSVLNSKCANSGQSKLEVQYALLLSPNREETKLVNGFPNVFVQKRTQQRPRLEFKHDTPFPLCARIIAQKRLLQQDCVYKYCSLLKMTHLHLVQCLKIYLYFKSG